MKRQTNTSPARTLNAVAAILTATFASTAMAANFWWTGKDSRNYGTASNWAVNVIDLNAESGLFPMSKSHARFFHNEERDMLHPNNAGHEQIAHAIMRRIASAPLLTNH